MRSKVYSFLTVFHELFKLIYSGRLRVLAYHDVPDKEKFETQVLYLKSNYNIISIENLLDFFDNEESLPQNPLLISFDDGDKTVFENGLPVLKKYDLPSCIFIITKLVDSHESVWIKRIEAGEMKAGKSYSEARKVVNKLKQGTNEERLKRMKKYPQVHSRQLSAKNILEMQENGMFIGNHTHTHPLMDKCSLQEIETELISSKQEFKNLGLKGYNVFAYPNGNTNKEVKDYLIKKEMKLLFLFDHRINGKKIDRYGISRVVVDADTDLKEFKVKVSGVHSSLLILKTILDNL